MLLANSSDRGAWELARAGKITASMMLAVMALGEGGEFKSGPRKGQPRPPGKARADYIMQLAAERITGKPKHSLRAKSTDYGTEQEPEAIAAYEAMTGELVEDGGFFVSDVYDFIGASPDFLIGDDGGGEVKCPYSQEVHLETLLHGVPEEHMPQIQGNLMVLDRSFWVFVSYNPEFPEKYMLFTKRIERDQDYIDKLESACLSLEAEVRAAVKQLEEQA